MRLSFIRGVSNQIRPAVSGSVTKWNFFHRCRHSVATKSAFRSQHSVFPDTSYETTNVWNSEPQNIEYRTAEFRSVESLRSVLFKNGPFDTEAHDRQNTLLRHSTFRIRYSIFAFSQFLFRLDWPLFRPAAALTPDT